MVAHLISPAIYCLIKWLFRLLQRKHPVTWLLISVCGAKLRTFFPHMPMETILLTCPDSEVHGANMGPTWVLSVPDGPHKPCYQGGLTESRACINIIFIASQSPCVKQYLNNEWVAYSKASIAVGNKSDIKRRNTLGCLYQYMCMGLRLWNSQDRSLNLTLMVKINHRQNNRDLNKVVVEFWSKCGDSSLNRRLVIARTNSELTHTHGQLHTDRSKQRQCPKAKTGFRLKWIKRQGTKS